MNCNHPPKLPNQTPLFQQLNGRLNMAIKHMDSVCQTLDFNISTVGYAVTVEVYALSDGRTVQTIKPEPVNEAEGTYLAYFGVGEATPLPPGLYGVKAKWTTNDMQSRTVMDGYLEVHA